MIKRLLILILLIFPMLATSNIFANKLEIIPFAKIESEAQVDQPLETILLNSPELDIKQWKELTRYGSPSEFYSESIPKNEQRESWSQLICFQYMDVVNKQTRSIKTVVDLIKQETLKNCPPEKITWSILQENEHDIIYEWVELPSSEGGDYEHEVARAILTDHGFHRIGFTRKHTPMSPQERDRWIRHLKENISVVSTSEANKLESAFSIADRFKDTVNLGIGFKDWKIITVRSLAPGVTQVTRLPPHQQAPCVEELLEVESIPMRNVPIVDHYFQKQQQVIQSTAGNKASITILKKTPQEVIYYFLAPLPETHQHLNSVVRTFVTKDGLYSIGYRRGLPIKFTSEEILKWQKLLEQVTVREP